MTYATCMGFRNAMSGVLYSNTTIIIAAVVLLMLGTGSVQGFATTLLLGVLSSMVTAILFSRFLMKRMVRIIQNPRLYVAGLSKLETAQTANGEAK